MKVALIPPRGLENYALRSKFHLALALPELIMRRTYGGMYTRAAELGDYVILDNGIAEGRPCNPAELSTVASKIGAQELVAPDILRDAPKTLSMVERYVRDYSSDSLKHMAVLQGKRMLEYQTLVEEFENLPTIGVLGIPRHMLETLESKACRIDLANWIEEKFPGRFEIHFLGTNPYWLHEIRSAAKYASHVRSVDTSMPFSYAIEGELLSDTKDKITRPKDYFEAEWGHRVSGPILRRNIDTLMEWADASGVRSEASTSALRDLSAE